MENQLSEIWNALAGITSILGFGLLYHLGKEDSVVLPYALFIVLIVSMVYFAYKAKKSKA